MVFSSITFIYYFIPIVFLLYAVTPHRFKNLLLFLASLVFYAWGEPRYVFLLLITIVIGYFSGLLLERFKDSKIKSILLAISILIDIGILAYYKYADFVIESINQLSGSDFRLLKLALPIGISFYTFQTLSYVIDVAGGKVKAQKSFVKLATYISMFPQMIAGPIVRYKEIALQLDNRKHTAERISYGIRRFVIGLCKKVIIANSLAELVEIYTRSENKTILLTWIYVAAVMYQYYFDFSGYSDMAVGLGKILGFDFPENFNYPFISKSISEFWRRWHMTLGGWFRDYLYIPLGGNRVALPRQIINILIVWMATGLWHGASWNFVIWGLYFALFLILEKLVLKDIINEMGWFSHAYLIFFVGISFVIFDSTSMSAIPDTISNLFGLGSVVTSSAESLFILKDYAVLLLLSIIGATPIPAKMAKKLRLEIFEPVLIAVGLLISTAFIINGTFNPFLYFRF